MKTVDIFIKSYSVDFKWLKYALLSIEKNVTGYSNVILLIPEHEKDLFDTRNLPPRTQVHYVKEYGKGYMFQQWCKMSAYKYSFAEFIMFSDSDCIFDHKIDLQDFIKDGKPEILYSDWDKVGDAICWKEPTERLIGEPVIAEFMRRNCLIYYRQTLLNIAEWKPDLESIIMSSEHFSEFNLIGAYAYKFEQHNYTFINTNNWSYTEPKAVQLWSHAANNEGQSIVHYQEYIRTLETILKSLGYEI